MISTMKRLFLPLLIVFSAVSPALAQSLYRISGVVCDSISGAPTAYATVRLVPTHGNAIAACAADSGGQFLLRANTKAGTYRLQVLGLGIQMSEQPITLGRETDINVGTITTNESSTALGEATVVAAKPLVKAEVDRIGYSVADDPDSKTSDMLDMLRKVPMVSVDGEDNITVNGSSSFKVYVNGKPNQMMSSNPSQIMKSFPASVVKKVEVITDPGAKYDAEGVSGVLNIVTDTETKTNGWTLTPELEVNTHGGGGGLMAMVQVGKLTLSAFGGGRFEFGRETEMNSTRNDFTAGTTLLTSSRSKSKGAPLFGHVEASYEFSAKDLLSVSLGGFRMKQKQEQKEPGLTRMTDADGNEIYSFKSHSVGDNLTKFGDFNTSVDFQHNFGKEEQYLTLSYRLSHNKNASDYNTVYSDLNDVPYELEDQLVDIDGKTTEHTGQVDFTTPIDSIHHLSVGAKYIYRLNRSDNYEWTRTSGSGADYVLDDDLSFDYRHKNDIIAGYLEYMLKLQKFSLRAGLRFESSHIKVNYPSGKRDGFSTRLNDWVPSLNLGYKLSFTQMLKASYALRINRPGIDMLSPYVNHSETTSISYGNPDLTSSRAHNFSLAYSLFKQKFNLNTTLSYSISTNGLTSYSFLDNGILNTTYGGFLHSKDWQMSMFMNWMITPKTTWMANLEAGYKDLKSYRTGQHHSGFEVGGFTHVRQDLPWWQLKFSAGGGVFRRGISLSSDPSTFFFYFCRLSRSFLDDRLTISLGVSRPFHWNHTFKTTNEGTDYRQDMRIKVHNMGQVGIRINWRIGDLKTAVKKVERTIENDDVVSGTSSATSTSTGTDSSSSMGQ